VFSIPKRLRIYFLYDRKLLARHAMEKLARYIIRAAFSQERRIITFIEFPHIIKRILKHLGLWLTHNHDPPPPRTESSTCVISDSYNNRQGWWPCSSAVTTNSKAV
jgi:hypothetical protein